MRDMMSSALSADHILRPPQESAISKPRAVYSIDQILGNHHHLRNTSSSSINNNHNSSVNNNINHNNNNNNNNGEFINEVHKFDTAV